MSLQRRTLLKASAATAAGLGGPFAGFNLLPANAKHVEWSDLRPVKDERDDEVRLHLPKGFRYRSFHHTRRRIELDDGSILPGNHDGMGAFGGADRTIRLVRNHELNNPRPNEDGSSNPDEYRAFGKRRRAYDRGARGGCTTIVVNHHGRVKEAYTSLNGTMMNCSGGEMPWRSWITCEETINGPDVGPDFTGASNEFLEKPHGYIFEVPVRGHSSGEPITRAGRFAHEAVSFDPVDGILYMTEDNFGFPSGFYRYIPKRNPMRCGYLDNEGKLQMLKVRGERNAPLHEAQPRNAKYAVRWVDIDDPNPNFKRWETMPTNDEAISYVGDQGREKGAALFSRLEGQVYDDGVVYFCSTQGGPTPKGHEAPSGFGDGYGQVWAYDCRAQTLSIVYESPGRGRLDFPDNVTTSKNGTLILCEDHDKNNLLRGLTRRGHIWPIALNRIDGMHDAEFAGSTFSPDGRTLFVNIQDQAGMTFAIWGDWESIGV